MSTRNSISCAHAVAVVKGTIDDGYKLLCWKIKMGQVEEALQLIALGAEVSPSQKRLHHTPLHHAVSQSSHALVSLILSKGSNVNAKGHNNKTPLHLAKSAEITKLLLNNGASMDAVTLKEGYTPLHQAIVGKHLAVVEVLLERGAGADVNSPSKNGSTALSLAVSTERSCLVELVLQYNPDVSIPSNRDCLKVAVKEKTYNEDFAQVLIAYGIGVNPNDANEYLRAAAEGSYWNIVEQLLKLGGGEGGCPKTNEFILRHSLLDNKPHVADIILSREVDLNDNGSVLNAAVVSSDIEIIKKLVARGADLNGVDINGNTALHCVRDSFMDDSRAKIAELLISLGANVNAVTNGKVTPLHLAAEAGHEMVVEVFLKAKAEVNAKDGLGWTPLHIAVLNCEDIVAEILLSNGADINLVNNNNKTALDLISDELKLYGSEEYWKKIAKLLTSHVTLIEAQQLTVSDVCLHDHEVIKDLKLACKNELAKLKIEKIGISSISFYNVLTKSEVWFAKCLANKEITKMLKSGAIKKMFPIYKGFLKKQLKNGLARKELIDQVRQNPLYFCRLLPAICFEKIYDYLNVGDLRMLILASSSINQ